MLRIYFCGVTFLLALFFVSCGCDEGDGDIDEDASIVDASIDVNEFDVEQNIDARRPNTKCPPDPPTYGTSCSGNALCSYTNLDPDDCHYDCFVFDDCPSGCSPSHHGGPKPCDYADYQCEDGTWTMKGSGDFSEDPCPPVYCICPDAGLDSSRRDSSTDDDSGTDDDAGN